MLISACRYSVFLAIALTVLGTSPALAEDPVLNLGDISGTWDVLTRKLRDTEFQTVTDTDRAAALTMEQLLAGQMAWRQNLNSIFVRFSVEFRRFGTPANEAERKMLDPGKIAPVQRYVYALKGDKQFIAKSDRIVTDPETFTTQIEATNGQKVWTYNSGETTGSVETLRALALERTRSFYLAAIGNLEAKPSGMLSFYVPTALESSDRYRVLPALEDVDGHGCHVVTCGPDTLWLDAQHGCALRRRIFLMGRLGNAPGGIAQMWCCKNLREVGPGTWWPLECQSVFCVGVANPNTRQEKLGRVFKIEAQELHINDVDDSTFEFTFPADALVTDETLNRCYYMPTHPDQLEAAIALGSPIVNGKPAKTPGRVALQK